MTDPDSGVPVNPIARAVAEARANDAAGQPPQSLPRQPAAASAPAPVERKRSGVGCFSMLVLCTLILTAGGVAVYYFTVWNIRQIGENFLNENITQTFIATHMEATSTNGNILETATAEAKEQFTDARDWKVWGTRVAGTGMQTMLVVPATYRYHVKLDGNWKLSQLGSTCVVVAPSIEPSLPVAFDTGKQEWIVKTDWLRGMFDTETGRRKLETTITGKLGERAQTEEAIDNVREASRDSVAQFVKNWLMSEDQWRDGGFTQIKVMFPDEEEMHPDEMPATLVFNKEPLLTAPVPE